MLQKVLIVDNSELSHSVIRSRLENEPVVVRSAYDGEGALSAARIWRPDVILLEARLPDADGFTLCRLLQEGPNTRHAAVIFVSTVCDVEDKVRALEIGASDYITKPFNGSEFKARVCAALRTQSRISLLAASRVRAFMTETFTPHSAAA